MRPGPPLTAAGCSLVRPNGATRACDLLFVLVMIHNIIYSLPTGVSFPSPPSTGTPELRLPPMCPTSGAALSYRTPKVRISFERR
jgi:hypothetical protein